MTFSSLDEAVGYIKLAAQDALANEVYAYIVKEMQDAIEELVYDAYKPEKYGRRGTAGGLKAKENMPKTISGEKLTVTNNTPPADDNEDWTTDKNLPEVIEYGIKHQYDYACFRPGAAFLDPRLFMHLTQAYVELSGEKYKALKAGLKRRGINVK